ncbi:glutamate-rich protein 3 isoform X2 [Lemur catta]|uniref:glutamate-rich protein 3 isoform X2 n=1 Tax=Lemur catta TaxID=9447 RepID=UPI001E26DCBE|nr:glutamate-rich protein 3 isoform X2 [Lemur catta]
MNHSHPAGLLAAYDSLTDKHLAGYFNNTRIRRHLLKSGLITRSGRILSEKEYKLNIMKRDHQKYIRECLAQAIFHKVLDMERYHQLEIKKKLETLARKERIQRFKGEHTRRFIENNMPSLSPHPPVGPRTNRGHSVLVDEGHSSPLALTAPRPYTAPGNMQPPIRLQPLPSNPAVGTVPKITSGSRSKTSLLESEAPFPIGGKKAVMKFRNSTGNSQRMNPYRLPNINSYMIPIPPPLPPPNGKITRENRSETWRRRTFRPTTAPNGLEPLFTRDSRSIYKTSLHSNAAITMIYLGKNVHLSCDKPDFRDEIQVYQQHCGGENLCVYKGKLLEKETFQFISKRHHGFPFSLTFFLNGMQVNRLSSCCEYKHRKGSRLGGKRGYFGFVCVERSSPCYKCIIAMGLDKKTSLPKLRKEKSTEKRVEPRKGEGKARKDGEYVTPRKNEMEGDKTSVSDSFLAQEIKTGVREVRTAMEEMEHKGKPGQDVWEDDLGNTLKYEYEEDFEGDEEKLYEKANEEGQADDQMNGISKSPSDDEKDNLDPEKESETSSEKAPDAHDNVRDEDDGCSQSDSEEDKQDIKTTSLASFRSQPYSSGSEDESAVGDREAHAENSAEESARSSSAQELSENDEPGKSHLPTEESLEIEIEEQKVTKADVETKPLPIEASFENMLEEEMEKETQGIAESLSKKSRKHVSEEEKEKDESKLWEGSAANVKDKKAGFPGVEKGAGQIITEAVASGCHSHYDTESGVSSADEEWKPSRKLEIDTGGASNKNLVEERAAVESNQEPKQVAQEMYTLEKKEAVEEDGAPQHRDATVEGKRDGALWGEAGVEEVPLGEGKAAAEQPALAEQPAEERDSPPAIASGAEAGAEAEGARRLCKEGLGPAGDAVGLNEGEAPGEQAVVLTVPETAEAAAGGEEGEQGVEKAALSNKAAALNLKHLQEAAAAPREAGTPARREAERGAAGSQAGSQKPDAKGSEEEASTDLEARGPMEDSASERDDGSEEAAPGGEEAARERKEGVRTETPWSPAAGQAAASGTRGSEGSPEALREEDAEKEETVTATEAESNREDGRKGTLPEEVAVARERRKAERPKTPLREAESEREEVTRANELKDADDLEEQKPKGEEEETAREDRSEEDTRATPNETESDAESAAPEKPSELSGDPGLPEDSLREREVNMFEAVSGFEKPLENITVTVLRKEGGRGRPSEAGDTGRGGGRAELRGREDATPGDSSPGGAAGAAGAPAREPGGQRQAPAGEVSTPGAVEQPEAKDQDCLAGLEGTDGGAPLQVREGVGIMTTAQEDAPEGDPMVAGKLSEEGVEEDPEGQDKERTLGTGVTQDRNAEGARGSGGAKAVELHQGGGGGGGGGGGMAAEAAAEEREVLAGSRTAEGRTTAHKASSFSDVAGEETWHQEDGFLGTTAAAERVAVEELALPSREGAPAVEEVTVTSTPEGGVGRPQDPLALEGKAPGQGQDQDGGPARERAASRSGDGAQEQGAAEGPQIALSPERQRPPSREGLQEEVAALPVNPDFAGTQEKQERTVHKSEDADVFP